MKILDLFCGAGGAGAGYHRAGFEVVGLDLEPQPEYPFTFIQGDALEFLTDGSWEGFDAILASPPCQALTPMSNRWRGTGRLADARINMIPEVRRAVLMTHLPFVIENVPGSREFLEAPILLHGGQFGLDVWRPRLFECNPRLAAPAKAPRPKNTVAIYGQPSTPTSQRWLWTRNDGSRLLAATEGEAQRAMEMSWASWAGVSQAIPPAYTEFLGRQLMDALAG